jgi:hypothetical protein
VRHIRHNEVCWFCRTCWQEMPILIEEPLGVNSQQAYSQFVKGSVKEAVMALVRVA